MSSIQSTSPTVTVGVDPLTHTATGRPVPDVVGLVADLADARAALDTVTRALDRERPTIDPRLLGHHLKRAWFRTPRTPQTANPDERWTAAAETAIDILRGLVPADTSTTGGGEGAAADGTASPAAATGAPAPGGSTPSPHRTRSVDDEVTDLARAMWTKDNLIGHTDWDELRPSIRSFYLARAENVLIHLAQRGWRPAEAPAAVTT